MCFPGYHPLTQLSWTDFDQFRGGPRTTPTVSVTGLILSLLSILLCTIYNIFTGDVLYITKSIPKKLYLLLYFY